MISFLFVAVFSIAVVNAQEDGVTIDYSDADKARDLARSAAQIYAQLPNYRNNWKRLGFSDDEMGSADRFIDATFAWGDIEQIATRVQAHLDAGATHVCVQPLNPNGILGDPDMNALEELARYMDA